MPDSEAAKGGDAVTRSALDKPLGELTEEDISQVTREDCRRYLKEKGMRRPSWNKSQAIQQVISLKTLLEARPDFGNADSPARLKPTPAAAEPEIPPQIEAAPAEESVPERKKDSVQTTASGDGNSQIPAAGKGPFPFETSISPRSGCERMAMCMPPVGQMTIFYNGNVNVYEGVPVDKARMIMQIAGSPNCPTYDAKCRPISYRGSLELPMVSPTVQPLTGKPVQYAQESIEEGKISREPGAEGPTSRKASLQRYLEKRKDRGRFKNKRRIGTSSSSGSDMYINQAQVRNQTSNDQLSRSGTCSPTQPKPPLTPTRCSSIENLPKNLRLCVDLNDEGPEDEG